MEMLALVFVYCCLIIIGLLPAFYEYEKALYESYQEVCKQYKIEKFYLDKDEKISALEWVSLAEAHDASKQYFKVSRNYGENFFFF